MLALAGFLRDIWLPPAFKIGMFVYVCHVNVRTSLEISLRTFLGIILGVRLNNTYSTIIKRGTQY